MHYVQSGFDLFESANEIETAIKSLIILFSCLFFFCFFLVYGVDSLKFYGRDFKDKVT